MYAAETSVRPNNSGCERMWRNLCAKFSGENFACRFLAQVGGTLSCCHGDHNSSRLYKDLPCFLFMFVTYP